MFMTIALLLVVSIGVSSNYQSNAPPGDETNTFLSIDNDYVSMNIIDIQNPNYIITNNIAAIECEVVMETFSFEKIYNNVEYWYRPDRILYGMYTHSEGLTTNTTTKEKFRNNQLLSNSINQDANVTMNSEVIVVYSTLG